MNSAQNEGRFMRLATWGKPAAPQAVRSSGEAAATSVVLAQAERFARTYAAAAQRVFSVVLIGMDPTDSGFSHALDVRLQVADSPDAAFGKIVANYLAENPSRRIVGHSTALVPNPCEVTSQWNEGVQTRETLEPAIDAAAGCLSECAARPGTKVYAFAATTQSAEQVHEYTMTQRFVHATSMAQASDEFRANLIATGRAVLCLRGVEVPMRRRGVVAGPHGGTVTMIETVMHDAGGHLQSIVSERFQP